MRLWPIRLREELKKKIVFKAVRENVGERYLGCRGGLGYQMPGVMYEKGPAMSNKVR